MRPLLTATALRLLTIAALVASPQIEAALEVFQTVGTDANQLKAFCELMQIDKQIAEKTDPILEAKVDQLLDELGADFKAALETEVHVDPASEDGKVLDAALDRLSGKCPRWIFGCSP